MIFDFFKKDTELRKLRQKMNKSTVHMSDEFAHLFESIDKYFINVSGEILYVNVFSESILHSILYGIDIICPSRIHSYIIFDIPKESSPQVLQSKLDFCRGLVSQISVLKSVPHKLISLDIR